MYIVTKYWKQFECFIEAVHDKKGDTFANSIFSPKRFNHYNVLLGIPWQQEMELLQMVYITKAVNHLTKRGDTFANGI